MMSYSHQIMIKGKKDDGSEGRSSWSFYQKVHDSSALPLILQKMK